MGVAGEPVYKCGLWADSTGVEAVITSRQRIHSHIVNIILLPKQSRICHKHNYVYY